MQHPYLRPTDEALYLPDHREIIVRQIRSIEPNATLIAGSTQSLPDTGDIILSDNQLAEVVGMVNRGQTPEGHQNIEILVRNYPRTQHPPAWLLIVGWHQAGNPTTTEAGRRLAPILN